MESNHCQIVTSCINGTRPVNEQSIGSMAVLAERLEKLKSLDSRFNVVEFSPVAKQLAKCEMPMAVC